MHGSLMIFLAIYFRNKNLNETIFLSTVWTCSFYMNSCRYTKKSYFQFQWKSVLVKNLQTLYILLLFLLLLIYLLLFILIFNILCVCAISCLVFKNWSQMRYWLMTFFFLKWFHLYFMQKFQYLILQHKILQWSWKLWIT